MLARREIEISEKIFETENAKIFNEKDIGNLAEAPPPFSKLCRELDLEKFSDKVDERSKELCTVEQFLIKITGKSYRKCLWLTRDQLLVFK